MRASIWVLLSILLMAESVFAQDNTGWEGKWIGSITVDSSVSDRGCGAGGDAELTVSGADISGKARMEGTATSVSGRVLSPDSASIDMPEWRFQAVKLSRADKEITARVDGRRCKSDWKLKRVN
jgi:hypothetical protein